MGRQDDESGVIERDQRHHHIVIPANARRIPVLRAPTPAVFERRLVAMVPVGDQHACVCHRSPHDRDLLRVVDRADLVHDFEIVGDFDRRCAPGNIGQ